MEMTKQKSTRPSEEMISAVGHADVGLIPISQSNEAAITERTLSLSQNSNGSTLFKRVKNYIMLAMLVLIFITTLIQTFRGAINSSPTAGADIVRFLKLLDQFSNFAPNIAHLEHSSLTDSSEAAAESND